MLLKHDGDHQLAEGLRLEIYHGEFGLEQGADCTAV